MTLANVYNKRQKSFVRDENMSKSCNFEKKNSIGKQHKKFALSNRALSFRLTVSLQPSQRHGKDCNGWSADAIKKTSGGPSAK